MSDLYGQQREARTRLRSSRPGAAPNAAPGADDHLDEDSSAAFALGALDGPERDLVEFHVRFCQRCAAMVERDVRTTAMLPFLVAPVVPPLDAKVALFARIGHTERARAVSALPVVDGIAGLRPLTLPASYPVAPFAPTAPLGSPPSTAARRFGWVGSALSVPLLVALVATGFWGVQLRDQLGTQGSRMSALEAQVANFGSGATTYQLSPGLAMPMAEGQLVLGADEKAGLLQVDLNSQTAAGDFQLMVMKDGLLVPVADLTVGADGKGQAQVRLDQPFDSYESVQIVPKASSDQAGSDQVVLQEAAGLGSTGSALAPMP